MAGDGQDAQKQILELQQELQQVKAQGSSQFDSYQTSLTTRYCSAAMSKLFSHRSRYSTWRKLWLHLAEAEKDLGIDTVTAEALEEMRAHLEVTDSDFETVRVEEKLRRHVRSVRSQQLIYLILTSRIAGCHGCEPLLDSLSKAWLMLE